MLKQKLNQIKRKYLWDIRSYCGHIWYIKILGISFDRREWYYFKSDYAGANGWRDIVWFLRHEVIIVKDDVETIHPECLPVPWHWRFSYTLKDIPWREPVGWIAVGWLLRAMWSAG